MEAKRNIRELVVDSLMEVDSGKRTMSQVMNRTLRTYQYMSKQERSFYSRLCEGTLEYELQLDYLLNQVSKTPVKKCRPYIRSLLRMSLYQILYMDGVPDEAVCNEAVKLAKKHGFQSLSGFVNGVLRAMVRKKDTIAFPNREQGETTYLSVSYAMPEWLVERFLTWYGSETTEAMLQAFLKRSPLTVRVNQWKTTREKLIADLEKEGIRGIPGNYADNTLQLEGINYLNRVPAFREGLMTVQDESSVLQGYLICPDSKAKILDICAAPGGKSMHAAERMLLTQLQGSLDTDTDMDMDIQTGCVTARDVSDAKIEQIQENIMRMQYPNLQTEVWDALVKDADWTEQADYVIADVPCSGLGVIGRKPDIKYRIQQEQLEELKRLQRQILEQAVTYVKPGGYLVYSTCTLNPEENEGQVAWMKEAYSLQTVDIRNYLPQGLQEELKQLPGNDLEGGYCTLVPGRQKCDGFFMALLRKEAVD